MNSIIEHFSVVPDPRRINHCHLKHPLTDILIIAILATIAGADTWVDIESFGKAKTIWLKQFLTLENGIPSDDTFARVFSIVKLVKKIKSIPAKIIFKNHPEVKIKLQKVIMQIPSVTPTCLLLLILLTI